MKDGIDYMPAKVPVLMARPVILNWINFLCDSTEEFKFSYQIYSAIIDKWIERESIGHTDRSLFDLSQAIAEYMFLNGTTSMSADMVEEIASQKSIQLEPIIAKSRSLLNRNGDGEYKFAHRSFFEYFVVFTIFKTLRLPDNLNFLFSLSGAKRFLFEILLDGANNSDPDMFMLCLDKFQQVKRFLSTETIIEFINLRDIEFRANNTQNGFYLCASLKLKESEKYNPQDVLFISNERFVDTSSKGKIVLRVETITDMELCFRVVKTEVMHPHVLMEFNATPPKCIQQTTITGRWHS